MAPEWLFQNSQEPATCPYSWPDASSPRCPIRCLKDQVWRYAPICDLIFPVASLLQVSPCNFGMFFSSPQVCHVRRTSHISWYENPNIILWGVNLTRPKYATFSSLLLLPTLRLKCVPHHPTIDCPQRILSLSWGYLSVCWGYLNVLLRVLECIVTLSFGVYLVLWLF